MENNVETVELCEAKTIEVSIPHYRKSGAFAYKIYSKDRCIQVCSIGEMESIQNSHAGLAWVGAPDSECTKEEFDEAFWNALCKIESYICK